MMRILRGCLTALVLLFVAPHGFAYGADIIRVRVTDFAPNYFINNKHWTGLEVELAEALVAEAGFSIEFVNLPWSRALAYMQNGQLDVMMNLSRTPDREAFMNFIGPERISTRVLIMRRENLDLHIDNLDQLVEAAQARDLKIGIQKDAKYSDEFDSRLTSDPSFAAHFDQVSQGALLAKKTRAGHNLGFFEDLNYAAYQLKHSPDFADLAIHPFVLSVSPSYFGLSKRLAPAKFDRLQAAFERLEKNGTLARIRARWEKTQ
jgi:ABC-type amino acid transport substrate-binding protein